MADWDCGCGTGIVGDPTGTCVEDICYSSIAYMINGGVGVVHDQPVAAASWTIPHTFARRPDVSIYAVDGEQVDADIYASPTMVVITFPAPFAGQAILV